MLIFPNDLQLILLGGDLVSCLDFQFLFKGIVSVLVQTINVEYQVYLKLQSLVIMSLLFVYWQRKQHWLRGWQMSLLQFSELVYFCTTHFFLRNVWFTTSFRNSLLFSIDKFLTNNILLTLYLQSKIKRILRVSRRSWMKRFWPILFCYSFHLSLFRMKFIRVRQWRKCWQLCPWSWVDMKHQVNI